MTENQEYQIDPRRPDYHNITEAWEIHDTIAIGYTADGNPPLKPTQPGWKFSYAEFGSENEHSFFNVRNRGEVGLAYCNLETKDQMPYVFHCYSIGLNFIAPPGLVEPSELETDWNSIAHVVFAQTIQNHVGIKFRVREDEKLLNNGMLTPEGAGTYGVAIGFGGTVNTASVTSVTPGMPDLGNRFTFPMPIEIPRGSTFNMDLVLSKYAQQMLQAIPGPGFYAFGVGGEKNTVPARALVRATLIGKRAVQQRGELHY